MRRSVLSKLDDLSEYDARRPLTRAGKNLLGLIKHSTPCEARYPGGIFGRPYPVPLPRFDDPGFSNRDSLLVTEQESQGDIVDGYERDDADWAAHRSRIEEAALAAELGT